MPPLFFYNGFYFFSPLHHSCLTPPHHHAVKLSKKLFVPGWDERPPSPDPLRSQSFGVEGTGEGGFDPQFGQLVSHPVL